MSSLVFNDNDIKIASGKPSLDIKKNKGIVSDDAFAQSESYNKARKRLVFEELLIMQLALLNLKTKYTINTKGIEFDKNIKNKVA